MNRKNTGLSAFSFVLCVTLMVNLLTYGASHAASHSSDGSFPLPSPVSCASLTTLRSLASRLTLLTNSRTGDQLEYVVIGAPISTNCVPPHTGPITVINGPEDLYIQHTYGEELVTAYQQMFGASRAKIVTYPARDGAGHRILLQYPMWNKKPIFDAIK